MGLRILTWLELQALSQGVGRALLNRDWSKYKTAWKWFGVVNTSVATLMAHLTQAINDLLPDTAQSPYLERWLAMRDLERKPATPARGTDALRVTGTPSSAVAVGDTLTHQSSGLRFQINEAETIPGGGSVDVDMIAIDTGSATRLGAGEILTFDSPPAGIEEEAVLVLDLDVDGDDQESIAAARGRLLDSFRRPPLGGASPDYEQWALAVTGIASAYVYPIRPGLGAVDLAGLHNGRGSERLLSGGEITELEEAVDAKKPVGVEFRVLTVAGVDVDAEVLVEPHPLPEYTFDWDDQIAPVVASWEAGAVPRKVTLTGPRPASMLAGHRVAFKPASGGSGLQYVIESLVSTDAFILEKSPVDEGDAAPASPDVVYSGGPLVDPVRDGILAHFDGLGPTNPDAHPYGAWEGNVRPENLYAIAQGTAGVRHSEVTDPAATVEMTDNPYPDDGTVYLAVPRRILVRKAW